MSPEWWLSLTFTLIGTGTAGASMADIFMLSDENGVVSLSNVPDDIRYQLLIRVQPEAPLMASQSEATGGARPSSPVARVAPFAALVEETAKANKMEAALLHAVITAESGYQSHAVSRKCATGLMQLMPETASRYGVTDRDDPVENVHGGARYLKDLLRLFDQDIPLTLAAYNAGETTVLRYGRKIPPYPETTRYVNRVIKLYDQYRILSPSP